HAEAEKQHAADQPDRSDHRGITGYRDVALDPPDHREGDHQERQQRAADPGYGNEFQGLLGIAEGDAGGQPQELAQGVGTASFRPLGMLDLQVAVAEARPLDHQRERAVALGHGAYRIDHTPVEYAEIGGARVLGVASEPLQHAEESPGGQSLGPAVLAVPALGEYHVVALGNSLAVQVGDGGRRVLQVAIHHHHPFAAGVLDSR